MSRFYLIKLIFFKVTSTNFANAAGALAKIVAKSDWSVSVEEESKDKKGKKPQDVEKIIAQATKIKTKQRKQAQKIINNEDENAEGDQDEDSDAEEKVEVSL